MLVSEFIKNVENKLSTRKYTDTYDACSILNEIVKENGWAFRFISFSNTIQNSLLNISFKVIKKQISKGNLSVVSIEYLGFKKETDGVVAFDTTDLSLELLLQNGIEKRSNLQNEQLDKENAHVLEIESFLKKTGITTKDLGYYYNIYKELPYKKREFLDNIDKEVSNV